MSILFWSPLPAVARHGASWLNSPQVTASLAAEIQAAGGIITAADLADSTPEVVPLMTADVAGYRLHFPPPPSSAVAMVMALRFLAGYSPPLASSRLLSQHRLVRSGSGSHVL